MKEQSNASAANTDAKRIASISKIVVCATAILSACFLALALKAAHNNITDAKIKLGWPGIAEGAKIALGSNLPSACSDAIYQELNAPHPQSESPDAKNIRAFCYQWQVSRLALPSASELFMQFATLLVLFGIILETLPKLSSDWRKTHDPEENAIESIKKIHEPFLEITGGIVLIAGILLELFLHIVQFTQGFDPFSLAMSFPWLDSKLILIVPVGGWFVVWCMVYRTIANAGKQLSS